MTEDKNFDGADDMSDKNHEDIFNEIMGSSNIDPAPVDSNEGKSTKWEDIEEGCIVEVVQGPIEETSGGGLGLMLMTLAPPVKEDTRYQGNSYIVVAVSKPYVVLQDVRYVGDDCVDGEHRINAENYILECVPKVVWTKKDREALEEFNKNNE